MKKVLQMLGYMAGEIKTNMAKYIIVSTNETDKYAIKYTINPTLTIDFHLLNTENNTTAFKTYSYEEFAALCSDVIVMEDTFKKLADDLVEAVQVQSSTPKQITSKLSLFN